MKKIFAFIILTVICWGVVPAQTPDVPQGVACEFPSVLDTLTGETPVCPTLGTSVVAIAGDESDSLVFTTPILDGEFTSAMQASYRVSVLGVSDFFYLSGSLNDEGTALVGGVAGKRSSGRTPDDAASDICADTEMLTGKPVAYLP